jgi:phosphosulfolactate synthase
VEQVSQLAQASRAADRRPHLWQIDLLRVLPMIGVVMVHAIIFTEPDESVGAGTALIVLHANREMFFFITAFVLVYATGAIDRPPDWARFWRRRLPLVAVPYLAWTLIYWLSGIDGRPTQLLPALAQLGQELSRGWFHLYFLLVTMQFYAVFPVVVWLLRRTRGHHRELALASAAIQIAFTGFLQYGGSLIPGWLGPWVANAQVEVTSYQFYFLVGALAAVHLEACLAWLRRWWRLVLAGSGLALALTEGWYFFNLRLGQDPQTAAWVFQPVVLLVVVATIAAVAVIADRLLVAFPVDGRVWTGIRRAGNASFGVYLSHMAFIWLITQPAPSALVGLTRMPAPAATLLVAGVALAGSGALVALLQRTPLSLALTGRTAAAVRPFFGSPAAAGPPPPTPVPRNGGGTLHRSEAVMNAVNLELPRRPAKPRREGLTMLIDGGLPTRGFQDVIESTGELIDFVKFGWGTAVVTRDLDRKIAVLERAGVDFYFGGTLFEKFVLHGRLDDYRAFCHAHRCRYVEVSNGTIPMANREKAAYVRRLAREFEVLSEVGYKDDGRWQELPPARWVECMREDLEAGARFVVAEARESGRSGICRSDGEPRQSVVEEILGSGIDPRRIIFEAPTKSLQTYFIRRLGPSVNLGNVAAGDVIGLETLRLGLRSDTLLRDPDATAGSREMARSA